MRSIPAFCSPLRADTSMNIFSDAHKPDDDANQSSLGGHLRAVANDDAWEALDAATRTRLVRRIEGMDSTAQQQLFAHVSKLGAEQLGQISEGADPTLFYGANDAPRTYTVKRHDSLSKIARAHKVALKALIAANPQIDNPDLIYPDQVIKLPG